MTDAITNKGNSWTGRERILFRFLFIYCCLQAIPLDPKYYRNLAGIHWSRFSYRDLFYLSRYTPQFFSQKHDPLSWGINNLGDWFILAAIAAVAAILWGYADRKRVAYDGLYYLLRVILRYRLAIAIMAYGFIKLFPMQQPYPSLSLLNTTYGAFSDWKIASLSYGVAPSLESFLGAVEILAAVLLLNRKSASIGAAILIGFTGNVFLSNLGYGGGDSVYCLYLLVFASILVFYDLPRWINLISLGKPTAPHRYRPAYGKGWFKNARLTAKSSFIIVSFTLFTGFSWRLYLNAGYQYPRTGGLANASGFYNVSVFRLNNQARPYSLTDSLRWQNVVLEKWNTLSIRTLQSRLSDSSNTEEIFVSDENRNYESSGSTDRTFYSYRADSSGHRLHLANKNPSYRQDSWDLFCVRAGPDRLILSGINGRGDSVYAVLDKIKKVYLLNESYEIPKNRSVFQ